MRSAKTLSAILLCLLVGLGRAQAQTTQQLSPDAPATDVTIIIEQRQVHFTAPKAVEEMRLQVFDPAGEMIYDSGALQGAELNWPWQQANGEMVKSGLYAYTLTLRDAGATDVRRRRGHLIVDRAAERDRQADRFWITSRNDGGIGAELAIARDDAGTIAGAMTSNKPVVTETAEPASGKGEDNQHKNNKTAATAAAAGTAGRIAKFTTTTDVGDSVLFEQNSNVGIGTTTPVRPLHLKGTGEVALRLEGDASSPDAQIETSFAGVRRWTFGSTGNNHPTPNAFYVYQDTNRSNNPIGQTRLLIDENGNVGIGTTAPSSPLHVEAFNSGFGIFSRNTFNLFSQGGGGVFGQTTSKDGTGVLGRYDGPASNGGWGVFGYSETGYAGVFGAGKQNGVFGQTGNAAASGVIGRNDGPNTNTANGWGVFGFSQNGFAGVFGSGSKNGVFGATASDKDSGVFGKNDGGGWGVFGYGERGIGVQGISNNKDGAGGYFQNTGGGTALKVIGTADIGTLRITGADVAEPFEVSGADTINPGTVMTIDPQHPGQLRVSAKAYDRGVAGVISGAGGINTGLTLKQPGTMADGAHPVALSGRVYCLVDASYGVIRPGDLLTTSSTPGHAMKARNHARAKGATIGKALTSLQHGKGLVLVLVTLQ